MLWRLHGTGRWWKYLSHLCFERLISFLHKVGEISNYKVEVKMCHSYPCFYYLDLWKHLDDFLDAIKRLLVTLMKQIITPISMRFFDFISFFLFSLPNVSFLLYSSHLQKYQFYPRSFARKAVRIRLAC